MTARVVFDCMVFLQGAARPTSPARACFQTVEDGLATLCVSLSILAERGTASLVVLIGCPFGGTRCD